MRSPGSIASAWRRRRSFMPTSLKPCSRVAAKFSGEPVRIHVVGAAAMRGDSTPRDGRIPSP